MPSLRMIPPATDNRTIAVNGRTYTCPVDGTIDVPDFDALVMQTNGWHIAATGGVGASAARPVYSLADKGKQFHDLTLGKNILWDGKKWRLLNTGAIV